MDFYEEEMWVLTPFFHSFFGLVFYLSSSFEFVWDSNFEAGRELS